MRNNLVAAICRPLFSGGRVPEGSRKRSCRPSTRGRNGRIDRYLRIIENGLGAGARAERPGCGTPLLTTFTMFHSVASHGIFPRRIRSSRRKARMQPPRCPQDLAGASTRPRIRQQRGGVETEARTQRRQMLFTCCVSPSIRQHRFRIRDKLVDRVSGVVDKKIAAAQR